MIEELIAEELELQALSQRQAVSEEQQSQQRRQKQRDELIDDLVSLLTYFLLILTAMCFMYSHSYYYNELIYDLVSLLLLPKFSWVPKSLILML